MTCTFQEILLGVKLREIPGATCTVQFSTEVDDINPNSIAYQKEVQKGTLVVSVNGVSVRRMSHEEVLGLIKKTNERPLTITFRSDSECVFVKEVTAKRRKK